MSKTNFSGPLHVGAGSNNSSTNSTAPELHLVSGAPGNAGSAIPTDLLVIKGTANSAAANIPTVTNAAFGQATTLTIPDPGVAAAKFVLNTATVDAASSTIVAVAGAANTSTVTVTLKDSSGNALTGVTPFEVYASSAADGLTIASAASTGFSVASGGVKNPQGNSAVTQGIHALSSATGTCVLSLLDTGKAAVYLVLVAGGKIKISAVLSSGSYG